MLSAIRADRKRSGTARGNQAGLTDGGRSSSEPRKPTGMRVEMTNGRVTTTRDKRKARRMADRRTRHVDGIAVVAASEVQGDEMPMPAEDGTDVLVAKGPTIASPPDLLANPSDHSGSSGEEHEALEQPPWQEKANPLWRNQGLPRAVQESHEVEKPMRAVRLAAMISIVVKRRTGFASG